ncbi:hypothetical protein VAEKB19_4060002 [Vibrio aestuarianus]|nr:hypothetical protein VAEKB19_4060002 [Vibrio aestuarianus]
MTAVAIVNKSNDLESMLTPKFRILFIRLLDARLALSGSYGWVPYIWTG